ncbi:helix-turn-helix domain-containing protein [Chlamydia sp. 17-3921]|uniref:helix-turn-helix domain-containing protein n=1 Tax=Chlamydia sp. 17-3921 TaxID=2675798 RepID=UPI001919A16A
MGCEQENCLELEESSETQNSNWVSITQAAKLHNVTRQAIYVAIKQKKLKASKSTRWEINLKDLEEYKQNRYSRKKSLYQGELIFDNDKGCYSVSQVAEILGVPVQKIYYATRIGTMRGERKGAAWVIQVSEIERYKSEYLSKQMAKKAKTRETFETTNTVSSVEELVSSELPS